MEKAITRKETYLSASASTTEHQVGDYADAGCTAGINSLTYYYA